MSTSLARALRCADVATAYGVRPTYALHISLASRKHDISPALGFALVEQESNFKHIFGCDAGSILCHQRVTRDRFRQLQDHVRAGGVSNGVGLTQITYNGYITAHDGLYKPRANVYFGLGLVAASIRQYHGDVQRALAVYNGGPASPSWGYAVDVLKKRDKWKARFK